MTGYKQFRRKQIAETRPYQDGERPKWRLHIQSIRNAGSPKPGDMTARNPKNSTDKWLVAAKYFADTRIATAADEQRNRAIETLTIARMNMSSPLRGIGLRQRQTATTTKREIGKRTMKTLLAGVAFAIAMAFSLQASAFPYCTKITWHGDYYVCTIDEE